MKNIVVIIALSVSVGLAACSSDKGIKDAQFGLDVRASNTTCLAAARPSLNSGVKLQRVFEALAFNQPVSAMQLPNQPTSDWFVVEQSGKVKRFPNKGNVASNEVKTFLDVGNLIVAGGEAGLLSVAFHPNYPATKHVFLSFTAKENQPGLTDGCSADAGFCSVVVRVVPDDNGGYSDMQRILGPVAQPYNNHNGGQIAFGPDGFFYWGLGDGGSGGDPKNSGQTLSTWLGKIHRVKIKDDLNANTKYDVPADNPYASSNTNVKEIFAYGFRNPWRFSVDQESNEVWVGDVGQNAWEEIDLVQKGGNYGWNVWEGTHCYNSNNPSCGSTVGFMMPVVEHSHAEADSITGGFKYRGTQLPALTGHYVYGDYVTGEIWGLLDDQTATLLVSTDYKLSSFAIDANNELYVLHYGEFTQGGAYVANTGQIYQFVADGSTGTQVTFPSKLSMTGCVEKNDPTQVAEGLIAYGVNAALWSDGAKKDRWFAIPDGTTIAVNEAGDFDLPVGSVTMKTFWLGDKRVETRLFVRHDDGAWAGYTYEWLDDQSDAVLLASNKRKEVNGQTWYYPTRTECLLCHTQAAGYTLGLELGQLNGKFVYTSTKRRSNQLDTLEHIGIFSAVLGARPVYPDPHDTNSDIESRARAYLHANCSNCHRPSGTTQAKHNLLYDVTLKDTKMCGVTPQNGDLGVMDAKLLVPGDTAHSLISIRAHARGLGQMPPLATGVADDEGLKVIDAWIDGLTSCPQ